MQSDFMSAREVSESLGVSLRAAQDMFSKGHIDGAVKIRRRWMVPRTKFRSQFGLEVEDDSSMHTSDLLG